VAENPATPASALAVTGFLAEAAAAAGRDARNEDVVADLEVDHGGAGLDDRADGLVTEDGARLYRGHIALEDVQVGAADRGSVDLDDRVGRRLDGRVGDGVPGALSGTVIDQSLHIVSFT
jgi:hypothetical protein